jgi:hypothetical protein
VDALECRRQVAECTRLSGTGVGPQSEVIMRGTVQGPKFRSLFAGGSRFADSNHRYPANFLPAPSIPPQFTFRNINRLDKPARLRRGPMVRIHLPPAASH